MKINNQKLEKERKFDLIVFVVGIVLIVIACLLWNVKATKIKSKSQEITSLHDIIISQKSHKNKINQATSVTLYYNPYQLTENQNNEAYYIISDDKYYYLAIMRKSDYDELLKKGIDKNPTEIKGITAEINDEVKKFAIDAYNSSVSEDKLKLNINDFENYFGDVCIDLTKTKGDLALPETIGFWVASILGAILSIAGILQYITFYNELKQNPNLSALDLEKELNSDSIIEFSRAKIIFTENYLINYSGVLRIIPYKEILSAYTSILRQNFVKTVQTIQIYTSTNKRISINAISLKDQENDIKYNSLAEFYAVLADKNDKIVVGYPQAYKIMTEKRKEFNKK